MQTFTPLKDFFESSSKSVVWCLLGGVGLKGVFPKLLEYTLQFILPVRKLFVLSPARAYPLALALQGGAQKMGLRKGGQGV